MGRNSETEKNKLIGECTSTRIIGDKNRTFELLDISDSHAKEKKRMNEVSSYNLINVNHLVPER